MNTLYKIRLLLISCFIIPIAAFANDTSKVEVLKLSEELLYKVKTGEPTLEAEHSLAALRKKDLKKSLINDAAKKTFWINMYNAWFQILAAKGKRNPEIFQEKLIVIAGIRLSLEEIEQGILRKDYKRLRSLKLPGSFSKKVIRQLAVQDVDYRIHFALNCGAVSCPPIAFYTYDRIDKQLDLATKTFLKGNTTIDHAAKKLVVTPLMDWYKEDFNGLNGIRGVITALLKENVDGYAISFSEYNWKEDLRNFMKE
jgi:hypothetical protein